MSALRKRVLLRATEHDAHERRYQRRERKGGRVKDDRRPGNDAALGDRQHRRQDAIQNVDAP
jgi:hypothetical protein